MTTWPWQTLCAEVAKLRVDLREGVLLRGEFTDAELEEQGTKRVRFPDRARKRWSQGGGSALHSQMEVHLDLVTGTVFKTDGVP